VSGRTAKAERAKLKPKPRVSTGWGAYEAGRTATLELEAAVDAYFSREPARITADPDNGQNLIGQEPLPAEWGDQMFVALQFLRSALEYVAFDLTMAHSPNADPSKTAFPVARTESEWTRSRGERRFVENMHPGAAAVIEALQPFQNVNPGYDSTLAVLHDFARIYRHRRPPILLTAKQGRGEWFTEYPMPVKGNVITGPHDPDLDYATPAVLAKPGEGLRNELGHDVRTFKQTPFHPEIGSGMGAGDGTAFLQVLRGSYRFVRKQVLIPLDEYLRPPQSGKR
jgi:hypothetical protein